MENDGAAAPDGEEGGEVHHCGEDLGVEVGVGRGGVAEGEGDGCGDWGVLVYRFEREMGALQVAGITAESQTMLKAAGSILNPSASTQTTGTVVHMVAHPNPARTAKTMQTAYLFSGATKSAGIQRQSSKTQVKIVPAMDMLIRPNLSQRNPIPGRPIHIPTLNMAATIPAWLVDKPTFFA